jgi:hypothetical protein
MKNIITIGDKQFYYTTFGTLAFGDPDTFVGRTIKDKDVQAFIPTVIEAGCIFSDILVAEWDGKFFLMAGKKRILVAHHLAEGLITGYTYNPASFKSLTAKVFINVDPNDQAAWAILDNQARTENPLDEWLFMRKLAHSGKWEDYSNRYKLNKQHWQAMAVLEDLPDPEKIVQYTHDNLITMTHVFRLAKLPKVKQEVIIGKLDAGKRVVDKDFKEVIQAKNLEAVERLHLNYQPTMAQVEAIPVTEPTNFAFYVEGSDVFWWVTPTRIAELKKSYPRGEGYRLVKVC